MASVSKTFLKDDVGSVFTSNTGVLLQTDYSLYLKGNTYLQTLFNISEDYEVLHTSLTLPPSSRISLSMDNLYNNVEFSAKETLSFKYIPSVGTSNQSDTDPIALAYFSQFTHEGLFIRPGTEVSEDTYFESFYPNGFSGQTVVGGGSAKSSNKKLSISGYSNTKLSGAKRINSSWADLSELTPQIFNFTGSAIQNIQFEIRPHKTDSSYQYLASPVILFSGCTIQLDMGEIAVNGEDLYQNSVKVSFQDMSYYYERL